MLTARPSRAIRGASFLYATLGVGFGAGAVIAIASHVRRDELPMTPMGFRAFAGPFERLGPGPLRGLLAAFLAICVLDVLAARWLWRGERRGAVLGLATTPAAFGLSLGFFLPIPLIAIPIRVALILAGRRSLR